MRTKIWSISLIVFAFLIGALAFLHFTQKNLSSIFGEPARPDGEILFTLEPATIRGIALSSRERVEHYEERQGQWLLKTKTTPDRADYRVLEAMLAFSANLTILESFPATEKNKKAMGLSPAKAQLNLKSAKGKSVANFSIGKKGAWHLHIPAPDAYSKAQNLPSVYLLPAKSDYIYLCSSPFLEDVLNNGFGTQRDLRPFFFPPELLAEINITQPNGTLVLARKSLFDPWSIEKPFKLDADIDAASRLASGLYKLTALEATNKPAPPSEESSLQIALRFFLPTGQLHEVPITLSLTEANKENAPHYIGRLDDWRKSIEFILPRSSLDLLYKNAAGLPDVDGDGKLSSLERKAGLITRFDRDGDGVLNEAEVATSETFTNRFVGIEDLPLSIESLRGASLSGLDLKQLKKVSIANSELVGPLDIEVSRSPISDEWQVKRTYRGLTTIANEFTFFTLKKALTEGKAIATVSDSVQDLTEHGLDTPVLSLALELFDGTKEILRFGESISEQGVPRFFLRRNDSTTVMEIDSAQFYQIGTRPYLWRDANVWNFNIIDLNILQIAQPDREALTLNYSDLAQTWSARQGSKEVTALLNENRANRYIENLEKLSVDRWLGPEHGPAERALETPHLTITALFKRPDEENSPIESKVLSLAAASRGIQNLFYYGKLEGDPHYFILDLEAGDRLAESLLEEE